LSDTGRERIVRLADLARDLNVDYRTLRGWASRTFPRAGSDVGRPWVLGPEQVQAARSHFSGHRVLVHAEPVEHGPREVLVPVGPVEERIVAEETPTAWSCPKDGTAMEPLGRRSRAYRCPECRGVFIDTAAMRRGRGDDAGEDDVAQHATTMATVATEITNRLMGPRTVHDPNRFLTARRPRLGRR
jgi:Transcription factor zinc-finger